MEIILHPEIDTRPAVEVMVLPFWQGSKKGEAGCSVTPFKKELSAILENNDFQGKEGEIALLYTDRKKEKRLLLIGCGKKSEASPESFRRAFAAVVKMCQRKHWNVISVMSPEDKNFILPLLEGVLLSDYRFEHLKHDSLKEKNSSHLKMVHLVGVDKNYQKACSRVQTILESVNFARDLINGNADDITPQKLCETARNLCRISKKLKATILDKKELTEKGLGLLLAVSRASFRDPALIILEYQGNPSSKEVTALVGKGITYDTGGLILKPKGGMETMKDDMSGAAAVLGTLKAVAELKLPVNIVAIIPTTENAIGSKSYKPGDVYKSYSGKTVEIYDTDAEGRLVLADAISYVQDHYKPSRIIDLATLTGGIIIALGEHVSGLFSTQDLLAQQLFEAGEVTSERLWRFPLYPEYRDALNSKIADIKNAADRKASSITGATFIKDFVKNIPWAHLDIAGTAYLSEPRHYHQTPATGVGVRLLVEFFSKQ